MTRITYTKNNKGDVLTTKEMLARDKVVNANILIKDDGFYYVITDLGTGTKLVNGVCKNITEAKKLLKQKFKDLGVVITDEVRKKI